MKSSPTLGSYAVANNLIGDTTNVDFKTTFEDKKESDFGERRRKRSLQMLDEKSRTMDVQDAFNMLRDHGEKGGEDYWEARLCLHMQGKFLDATTAALVSSISGEKQVHWVTGTAATCTSVFKPIVVGASLPDHGPIPGESDDGRSMWWKHERVREFLLAADPSRQIEFRDERNALEQLFVERLRQSPLPRCDSSIKEIDQQIEECWRESLVFEDRWYKLAIAS